MCKKSWTICGLAFVLLGVLACGKKDKSSLNVNADYLHFSGRVVQISGASSGVSNANIYLGHDGVLVATSDSEGRFSFTTSDTELSEMAESESNLLGAEATGGFKLYFETSDPVQSAVSESFAFTDRGQKDLGEVLLETSASVSGVVQKLSLDGGLQAASGIRLLAGNKQVVTGADGGFDVAGLPAGKHTLYAFGDGFAFAKSTVSLIAGEKKLLDHPMIVFLTDVVEGWVTALPRGATKDLVAAGHPYQRSFVVAASPSVKYVRFHHDRQIFNARTGDADWREVTERLGYDFPGNGGHNLYVQFSDASKSKVSSVLTVQATVDIFDDSTGMIIGDGSGVITRRSADVHISVPRAATKMRLHHDINMLTETEFLGIAAITEYVFPPLRSPAGGMMPLFLQFSDAQGNLSVVYNTSVVIDLFPAVTDDVLTIEDGASVTPNRLVNLKIKIPANAYQMRVFEAGPDFDFNLGSNADGVIGEGNEGNSEATKIWVTAQNNFFYNFSSPGSKHLFLQFRDIDGSVSAAYSAVILVQPFLPISQGGFGFTINGGAPTTLVRNVTLSIAPPPNAVAFRFAQDRTPMPIDGWLTLVPNVPFTMFGRGLHAIFMQFIDANGDVSLNYSQSISVDLFGAFPGAFIINGGSTTTDNPVLALSIQPPVDASEMLITLNPDQIILNPALDCRSDQRGWMSVNSFATITVQSFGPKTVYVKFRNQTCDESGFIQRTVLYAP